MASLCPPLIAAAVMPPNRYSKEQVQAELDDVADQLRKEEEARSELEDQVKGLHREMEAARSELAFTRANAGAAGATAAVSGATSAADTARLAELEGLLEGRSRELADMTDK